MNAVAARTGGPAPLGTTPPEPRPRPRPPGLLVSSTATPSAFLDAVHALQRVVAGGVTIGGAEVSRARPPPACARRLRAGRRARPRPRRSRAAQCPQPVSSSSRTRSRRPAPASTFAGRASNPSSSTATVRHRGTDTAVRRPRSGERRTGAGSGGQQEFRRRRARRALMRRDERGVDPPNDVVGGGDGDDAARTFDQRDTGVIAARDVLDRRPGHDVALRELPPSRPAGSWRS
jgi:hypothetical protein